MCLATSDPDLEETLFQQARYLMISNSRPGDMPAKLQGVWNILRGCFHATE
jgi:alpha-L-fucosidase 2